MGSFFDLGLAFLISVLVFWGRKIIIRTFISRSPLPFPPGPEPKPLIGNALDLPVHDASQTYAEWGKKYNSPILHLEALGKHIIILNDFNDAEELLEKRAKNFSDRPVLPITKLIGAEFNMALMGYNDEWRLNRKISQQNFRQAAAHQYLPIQTQKVHDMLRNLLERPEDFEEHNKLLSISIPLATMYGYEAKSLNDPCIQAADKAAAAGSKLLLPGSNYIDILPILGRIPPWVPGTYSVRLAAYTLRWITEMKRIPTEYIHRRYTDGYATPGLVGDMLQKKYEKGISKEEEEAVQNIAYTVYSGASDTTISATASFFYYMATCPDVQRKAHEEIDRVVGSKRLPDYDDRLSGRMPFMEAIYREVLRIAAPLPLGLPHAASEDDHYKGYFIPKGSIILANIWAMTHDANKYPAPFIFRPERFLNRDGNLNNDSRVLAYGFGRRICVGKYVGSSTLWLIMASVLSCFIIEKKKDEKGGDIEIADDFEEAGVFRHKKKFDCSFTIRSPEAQGLVMGIKSG